jgi:hypothetical protein
MNTCPDCKNDLVCHDQGECLRPTPETDLIAGHKNDVYKFATEPKWDYVVPSDFARTLERQRDEARAENARLREAVKEARDCILRLIDNGHDDGCAWINYANSACTCGVDDGHTVLSKLQPFVAP